MRGSPSANLVRELVWRTFKTLSFRKAARTDLNETILIDQGRCVGRSYRVAGFMAMWLVEVGLVHDFGFAAALSGNTSCSSARAGTDSCSANTPLSTERRSSVGARSRP